MTTHLTWTLPIKESFSVSLPSCTLLFSDSGAHLKTISFPILLKQMDVFIVNSVLYESPDFFFIMMFAPYPANKSRALAEYPTKCISFIQLYCLSTLRAERVPPFILLFILISYLIDNDTIQPKAGFLPHWIGLIDRVTPSGV